MILVLLIYNLDINLIINHNTNYFEHKVSVEFNFLIYNVSYFG